MAEEENWTLVSGDRSDLELNNEDEGGSVEHNYRLHTTALIATLRTADHGLYQEVSKSP